MQIWKPYYLVATPSGEIVADLLRLQKFISRRFRMYQPPYPSLHLTVGVIESGYSIDKAFPVLSRIAEEYEALTVRIDGERCFPSPFSSVGVAVSSAKLAHLAGHVEGALLKARLTPRTFSGWNFHINLVSPLYAKRRWSAREFMEACKLMKLHGPSGHCYLSGLELWEPDFPPLTIIERFPFKSRLL